MKKHYRIAPEIKEQILKRIKEEGISVSVAAKEHGIAENTVYAWLSRGVEGGPTMAKMIRLERERKELLELVGELTVKLSASQKKI